MFGLRARLSASTPRSAPPGHTLLASTIALCSLSPSAAHAHAPPFGSALVWPSADSLAPPVVLTNRGLLFPEQGSYRLRCTDAYHANTAEPTRALLSATGERVLVRAYAGVFSSSDRGCTFTRAAGLPSDSIGGFAQPAEAPDTVLISSLVYSSKSALLRSDDRGLSFAPLAEPDVGSVYEALLIATHDEQRIYAGGSRYDASMQRVVPTWSVSHDGGKSFNSVDCAMPRTPLGTHPHDEELVFVAEQVDELGSSVRLLRSANGGQSFETVLESSALHAFASSADGEQLWVGAGLPKSPEGPGGLLSSRDEGLTFQRVGPAINAVTCLAQHAGRLWICANLAPNRSGVWSSTNPAASLDELLTFDDVREPIACPDDHGVCDRAWADWSYEQTGLLPGMDAGGAVLDDAGAAPIVDDAGGEPPDAGAPVEADDASLLADDAGPAGKRHSGCALAAPLGGPRGAWLLLLVACSLRRRRVSEPSWPARRA